MSAANAGRYLYWVVTILWPIQRLARKKTHRCGPRYDEVDEFSALVANEGVSADDHEPHEDEPDDRSHPGRHAVSVPFQPSWFAADWLPWSCSVAASWAEWYEPPLNPNLMRAIDFWVGIPLTWLLTVAFRIQRLVGLAASPNGRPRNILFIQLAEMGTMVVAYPALRKARELYPDATLHVLCFTQIRSSVEMLDIVASGNIITIDAHSALSLARDTIAFPWRARRRRIDTVINMEAFVRYSSVLSYLSGAARRVGFHRFNQEGLYTGDLLTHKVLYNAHIHAAHTFLDLVHALDAPADGVPRVKRPKAEDCLEVPKITTDAAAAAEIWAKLRGIAPDIGPSRKLVMLNPNASARFPLRRMPLESFTALARTLLEDPDVFVLITGVASEKPDAQYICERLGSPRVLDLAGRTTLKELLHLFDLAHVLVTNDSGPAHFAALTRIHVVVFFGPEVPERYRPLATSSDVVHTGFSCSPCIGPHNQRLSPCNDNVCMKHISVGEVSALVRSRLEAARS